MMKLIFIFASLIGVAQANASECASMVGRCDYYQCLRTTLNCDSKAVIAKIARPYCRKFENTLRRHSALGQSVLKNIKLCLQNEIEREAPSTCAGVDRAFIDAHVTCYEENGYCNLGLVDRWQLAQVAWPALENKFFQEALFKIELSCAMDIKKTMSDISLDKDKGTGGGGGWNSPIHNH